MEMHPRKFKKHNAERREMLVTSTSQDLVADGPDGFVHAESSLDAGRSLRR